MKCIEEDCTMTPERGLLYRVSDIGEPWQGACVQHLAQAKDAYKQAKEDAREAHFVRRLALEDIEPDA